MHTQAEHSEHYHSPLLSHALIKKAYLWGVVLIAAAALSIGIFFLLQSNTQVTPAFAVPPGPIHWHPYLQIIIDGEKQAIPANIGLSGGHKPMHTHETNGIIHVENHKPTARNMILGYFFEVWEKKFNKDCIFEYCTDTGTLKMTVNGNENHDFELYALHDGDEIVIEYRSYGGTLP